MSEAIIAAIMLVIVLGGIALGVWGRRRLVPSTGRDERANELQRLIAGLDEAMLLVGDDGRLEFANEHAVAFFDGYIPSDLDRTPMTLDELLSPGAAGALERARRQPGEVVVTEGAEHLELTWYPTNDGRAAVRLRPDTTDSVQAAPRPDAVFAAAPIGMAVVRVEDNRIIDANEALASMLAIDRTLLIGCTLREFTHPDDVAVIQSHRARLELGIVETFEVELRLRRRDGDDRWAQVRMSVAELDAVPVAVVHIDDLTDQRHAEAQAQQARWHDPVTGLGNRAYLRQLLAEKLGGKGWWALVVVDLDGFSAVNHRLGDEVGDRLLGRCAERLQDAVTSDEAIVRIGGDRFAVVVADSVAEQRAEALHEQFMTPIEVDQHHLSVTVSVGVAYQEPDHSPDALLAAATEVAERARDAGGNRVIGGNRFERAAGFGPRLVAELRQGIEHGDVVPYYQPIVDLADEMVLGLEVVARWLHPERGLLYPSDFVPMATDAGLLGAIEQRLLNDAVEQLARWQADGHRLGAASLSINIDAAHLRDRSLPDRCAEITSSHQIDAAQLWIEIDETALLADDAVADALQELSTLGARIVFDNYGVGRASLTLLGEQRIGAVKLDPAMLDGRDQMIEIMVHAGTSLGFDVLGMGIETTEHVDRLRRLGVTKGQGYRFGRPRPAELIEREPELSQPPADR